MRSPLQNLPGNTLENTLRSRSISLKPSLGEIDLVGSTSRAKVLNVTSDGFALVGDLNLVTALAAGIGALGQSEGQVVVVNGLATGTFVSVGAIEASLASNGFGNQEGDGNSRGKSELHFCR